MTEFRTIEERYGTAVEADDLTMRFERGGAIDTLTAAGMAGARNPMAMSLWRWVYGQDMNERHAVLAGLVKWMKVQEQRRRWNKSPNLVQVVMAVADWYHSRVCAACHGTRYVAIPGTPALSDTPCPACHGTGERSIDKLLVRFGPDWIKRGKDLQQHIDNLAVEARGIMLRKLKRDIDEAGL